jgi:dipeptidyl aminopeptidase/acylaminoacyl peptidase
VHEYGGGACWWDGDTVFFSDFDDSRLYRQDDGGEPRPITPEPPEPHALRYADGCVVSGRVVCVRERHEDGEVHNDLVSLPADGSEAPCLIASGHDFYSRPRANPSGDRLSWLVWDHPRMPWDGTELWTGDVDGGAARKVAGGEDESIFQPDWSPDGVLHFSSDRSGWWNLQRLEPGGSVHALTEFDDREIGGPEWVFGMSRYVFLADGRIACVVTRAAIDSLEVLDPETGRLAPLDREWTSYGWTTFTSDGRRLAFAGASPRTADTLSVLDPDTLEEDEIRRALDDEVDPAYISVPRAIEFPTADGPKAHAFYYPPENADSAGPDDERPPLRVICHGGPTAHSPPRLDLQTQLFTSRGIGVVDVNYRGSSGFGREYRRLLNGRWGEIDWQDCVAAARHLAEQDETDAGRTWVEGGSAGGYVVLCALVFDPEAFGAGVSYFGVADAEALARETHKFESRYLDTMIGPYPERADLYRARSPVNFADRLERPLLLLQGLDDKVVPPSQAEAMVDVLERKGIPYAYLAFEGEGHGFRKEENILRSIEATLSFAGQIFGFEPADELEPLEIANLSRT